MTYTPDQIDSIKAHILKMGYNVNEQGCEVWNSSQRHRAPQYKLLLGDGKSTRVNIRTFLWMNANGGSFVKDTHASCGTTNCIKLEHISPGRKKNDVVQSKTVRVHTESEIAYFLEKIRNGITQNDSGCNIWGGGLLDNKYPGIPYKIDGTGDRTPYRRLYICKFLFKQKYNDYNSSSHTLTKTCGEDRCVNVNHFHLVRNKKKPDLKKVWDLLLSKTTVVGDCLVLKKVGPSGYGTTKLGGVNMGSHRVSYIINKNNGEPLPDRDEDGNKLVVRHMCHKQRGCINPNHLQLGTLSQNAYEDRIDAGTLPRGETCASSKVSETTAQNIKLSLRDVDDPEYLTKQARAEKFGSTENIVEAIDNNRSWSHLPNRSGEVIPNVDEREKAMKRQRVAREREWTQSDFERATEYIKQNVVENEEIKAGSLPPGPCWLWKLSKKDGYGNACFNGRGTRAHILSLESQHGRFSHPDELVRHLCNARCCCNPDHLRFGTRKDNAIDIQLTSTSKSFKLDASKVRMIRESNTSSSELARILGITQQSVTNVRTGKTWSSIE